MPDWNKLFAERGPQLALTLLAASKGGKEGVAAYMRGLQEREQYEAQRARQSQMDSRADELHQAQIGNLNADNDRQNQQLELTKVNALLQQIAAATQEQGETATDPVQAESAIKQRAASSAQLLGLPPDTATGLVPSIAPKVAARQKREAKELYERAEKRFNPKGENPEWETSITLQTPFGDKSPAQLREMYDAPAVDATGAPALPPKAKRALQIMDLGGKKMAVDPDQLQHGQTFAETPNASSGTSDSEPLVAIMGPDNQPVLVPRSQAVGKRPASNREQGRPVQSSDANRIIDIDASLTDLDTLESTLTETSNATGMRAKAGAAVWSPITELTGWGTDAKKRQGVINRVKQVIGKALEDGVLRKEDEQKYTQILPTIIDLPEVAMSKLKGLRKALIQRREITLEGLADAGFDTSKFAEAGAKADPLGIR